MMSRRRLLGVLPALVGVPVALTLADGGKVEGRSYEVRPDKKYIIVFEEPLPERVLDHLADCARRLKREKGLDISFMSLGQNLKIYEVEGTESRT